MNLRVLVTGTVLLASCLVLRAETPNDFYVKVSYVDEGHQEMEARFVTVPDNFRIVCKGETINKFSVGDYVRAEIKEDAVYIGKTPCPQARWHRITPQGVKR